MVDESAFEVGENLAVTPGAVVLRTPVFELIQYEPQTAKVREVPVLFVPPMINKYYVVDLAPDRSMVEHLVKSGQQVFAISWRNPDGRHAEWGAGHLRQAVIEAMDAVEAISRQRPDAADRAVRGRHRAAAVVAHLAAKRRPSASPG